MNNEIIFEWDPDVYGEEGNDFLWSCFLDYIDSTFQHMNYSGRWYVEVEDLTTPLISGGVNLEGIKSLCHLLYTVLPHGAGETFKVYLWEDGFRILYNDNLMYYFKPQPEEVEE